jgi:DHA2 family methylenomycin A resistance protein-like MFS transporter
MKLVLPPKVSQKISLLALCLGYFMVIIDVTIVNIALPSLAKSLQGGISWLQWVVDGYTLTFACLLLSVGNLSDRYGPKTIFLSGLILFVITSFGCGIAYNFGWLTFFRLLQGVGGALLVPSSLALINASIKDLRARAKAIGIWASIGGIAAALGPVIGAILISWFGWRAIFFVNVPIGIVGVFLTIKYVAKPIKKISGEFDFLGQIFIIVSIAALAFGLIEAGRLEWHSPLVITSLSIFILTFILFLWIEHRVSSPMLPLSFFQSSTFSAAQTCGVLMNIGFYSLLFILPLYFQQIKSYSVLMTGLAVLPLPGLTAIGSFLGGRMTSYIGSRIPMIIGYGVAALGFLSIFIMLKENTEYFKLILPLALIGLGASFTMPAATIATIHAVPEDNAGIASGTFNTSRQIGTLLGVALAGTIISFATDFSHGMKINLMMSFVVYVCGSLLSFMFIKTKHVEI